ncbi:N-6 DNA methylase [Candidatus Tisiphia endosymbiont of Nemotelus nigrinus]|uniref:N-6 DNA methylase n=1 Tax=Candidatus Tisiphia endosymbiont of Nemotelus nigrinus TaxID=3066263 RepID=UPI00312C88FB
MSEELLQRDLIKNPQKIGTWNFYNIGATTISDLKKADIIRSIDYGDVLNKRVDGIITKQKEVIAIVEFKQPKNFNTKDKKNNAILQEIEVAKKLKTKLIIATDTQETIWINVATGNNVKTEEGDDFKYLFDSKDINLQKVINEIIQSINEKNDRILPKKLVNPTDLAKQIWQDVWSVSGATPENCLYTFVELFIFKYLSDLKILQGTYNFYTLLRMYEEGNETNTVLQHYANIIRPQIKELFPENVLDKTTIINGSIFISKEQKAVDSYGTVFRKVLHKFRDYGKLEHIDHDFKSKLFESFLKESISKKEWGQFFTPIKVVCAINEMAEGELKEGMTICDPACGVGKFPLEFIKDNLDKLFKVENNKIIQKVKIVGFDKGFDKDEQKTIILAKANMLIYFCELIKGNIGLTKEFAKIFNDSFILKTNSILGTLSETEEEKYDLILTNPPYVTSGSSNLKKEISKSLTLKNHYKINAMGIEGLFMEWIIKALKKGGKAFIVVPDGIFNRQNDKNLRQYILDSCYIDAIVSLPLKTFFTTQKKTYILAITKKSDISDIQTDPVFTYLVSEIGESRDVNRFDIEQDDLKEAVNLYNAFKGNKKYFATLNHDRRCKIVSINEFDSDKNWSVERWWSKEEKIELGIEKIDQLVSISEFSDIISDLATSCNEFTTSLQDIGFHKINDEIKYCQNVKIEDIFNIKKGIAKYTKTYIKEHKGLYPVYSANTQQDGVLGYINHFDHDVESIQITTNGYAGTVFYRSKHKFSINGDARLYIPKCDNLDCLYLSFELQKVLDKNNFNWEYKPTIERTRNIEIKIPITATGEFDLPKQKEIAEKYRKITEIKNNITRKLERIENIKVDIGL